MLQGFVGNVQREAKKVFPKATIEYEIVRSTHLYFRIKIDKITLIDIYFNTQTNRKDFSLIYRNNRIYGVDNLLEWHQHPYDDPTAHIPLFGETSIQEIFAKMKGVVDILCSP